VPFHSFREIKTTPYLDTETLSSAFTQCNCMPEASHFYGGLMTTPNYPTVFNSRYETRILCHDPRRSRFQVMLVALSCVLTSSDKLDFSQLKQFLTSINTASHHNNRHKAIIVCDLLKSQEKKGSIYGATIVTRTSTAREFSLRFIAKKLFMNCSQGVLEAL